MKIIALSDIHGHYSTHKIFQSEFLIPFCDVLIFAGDYSFHSNILESDMFLDWFTTLDSKYKIVVPGNHDYYIEDLKIPNNIDVLTFGEIEYEGIRFFGSSYTPKFYNWNYMESEKDLETRYNKIPNDIDVLISHGPPKGILDNYKGENIGSVALKETIDRIKPKVFICGHNHEKGYFKDEYTEYYNVSICDQDYFPMYSITEINLK
jgi:Icc-related predicted phosphoesterase